MNTRWREIRTVFSEEIKRGTSRTWYRISLLAVPAILLILLAVVPLVRGIVSDDDEGDADDSRVGLVDMSGVVADEAVRDAGFRTFERREAAVASLVAGEVSSVYVVPRDYLKTGRVEWLHTSTGVVASISSEGPTEQVRTMLRGALVEDKLAPEVKNRFLWPAAFDSTVVSEDGSVKEGAKEVGHLSVSYIFAFVLLISILTGGGFLLESVAEEKQNRMIEILLTSVSPLGMMAGKVFGMGSIALLQVLVWGGSAALIGPRILGGFPELAQLTVDPLLLVWAVAFFLAGYFVVAVVMAGIGAATSSYRESSQISMLVTMPSVVPLMFFSLIAGDPDGAVARVLSFIPITAPITMMLRTGNADIAVAEIVASLAVTVLGGLVLLWASARVFRAGLLMYGQRMSLGRVLSALREAA